MTARRRVRKGPLVRLLAGLDTKTIALLLTMAGAAETASTGPRERYQRPEPAGRPRMDTIPRGPIDGAGKPNGPPSAPNATHCAGA